MHDEFLICSVASGSCVVIGTSATYEEAVIAAFQQGIEQNRRRAGDEEFPVENIVVKLADGTTIRGIR